MSKEAVHITSEAVSEGHPDKVADRISDEIVDALLAQNPRARAAVETLVTRDLCVIAGEIGGAEIDAAAIARRAITTIGYRGEGFDPTRLEVIVRLQRQSLEIAAAVGDSGAGDQGLMFGYACRETPLLMPAPIHYAQRLVERLAARRHAGDTRLGPDAKSQVTLEYLEGAPRRAHTLVVSHQHRADVSPEAMEALVRATVSEVFPAGFVDEQTVFMVNPSGSFVLGGPAADTGLTGRKIIVDTYGGAAPHGGGAFSGKDPTKVDRSAAYAARWLAKNLVAAGLADRCLLELAYVIGVSEPITLRVNTSGTGVISDARLADALRALGSLSQRAIRERLGLDRPIYAATSSYGHFGRVATEDGHFSWERTDLVPTLRDLCSEARAGRTILASVMRGG